MAYWFILLVGIIGGIAAAIQGPLTGVMGRKLGDIGSVFFTYGGGGLVVVLTVFFLMMTSRYNLNGWQSLPWYVFLAGPLGLIIIASLSFTVPRLGAVTATGLFILGWLFLSAIIDQFGWFGVSVRTINPTRIIGIVALLIGTYLVSK